MMNMMEATDADSDAEFTAKGVKAPLWSGAAYSNAISKSMRAMMTGSRLRTGRQEAAVNSDTGAEPFADAVARKDKEKMLDALAKDPSILRRSDARLEDGSPLPSFATSEASSHDFVGKTLQQKTEDALADDSKGSRSKKHAQEQLEFMKKEQSLLRHTLLSTKSQLQDVDQARADLQLKMEELRLQITSEVQQRKEAQLEAQVLARNHQAMTLQLHTTVQMLLNIVPLARKVYGAAADDFLSGALAQATGGAPPSCYPSDPMSLRRKSSPVQLLKTQLQHSVLAHGCVQKWANSTPSSALAAAESVSSDAKTNVNASRTEDPSNSEKKSHNQTGDSDSSAA
ncbi:hypothetical protein JG688_00005262 [Phytophthora aleatoria]|uniref:Uncharacterized protein n=1 Tax=Phytophthora aleatoria TaxID=2496075 RepID=A0A8J5M6Q6_9STRA|nr:hypothetical protein JG688_00005262 [Phytophthora aleatoria]